MKKLLYPLFSCLILCVSASAATLYWQGTTNSMGAVVWTTDQEGLTTYQAPGTINASFIYGVGDKHTATQLNMGGTVVMGGIINKTLSGVSSIDNYITASLTVGTIWQESATTMVIRRSNGVTTGTLTVNDTVTVKKGTINLGTVESQTQAFKTITFGGKIYLGEADAANATEIRMASSTVNFNDIVDVNTKATLAVYHQTQTANASNTIQSFAPTVNFASTLTVSGGGLVKLGRASNSTDGLKNVVHSLEKVYSTNDITVTGAGSKLSVYAETVDLKNLYLNTSGVAEFFRDVKTTYRDTTTNVVASSTDIANVEIEKLKVDTGAVATFGTSSKALTSLEITNLYIGDSTATGSTEVSINASTAEIGTLYFGSKTNMRTAYGENKITLYSDLTVTNKIELGFGSVTNYVDGSVVFNGNTLTVNSDLEVSRAASGSAVLALSNTSATAGTFKVYGLTSTSYDGTAVDSQSRIVTAGAGKLTNINLTGSGNASNVYSYGARIHDFSGSTKYKDENKFGEWKGLASIGLVKDGADTQKIYGQSYYRGDTVINSGKLFMGNVDASNSAGNNVAVGAYSSYGISTVRLNGGEFGAMKYGDANGAIGTLRATDLVWSGGTIVVDFNGLNCDLIQLTGKFDLNAADFTHLASTGTITKGSAATEFFFQFNGNMIEEDGSEYLLISWTEKQTDFEDSEFKSNLENWAFESRANGLYAVYAIPEPSAYAAIFALFALGFVLRRKSKLNK